MRTLLPLFLVMLGTPIVRAQALRVTTDKAAYAYGEPVRVTATFVNTTADTLAFDVSGNGPPCYGAFVVDGYGIWPDLCLSLRRRRLAPGARVEWVKLVEPERAGLPERGTSHVVRVRFGGEGSPLPFAVEDSARFEAPPYRGGTARVQYRAADSLRLHAVRDSIGARATRLYVTSGGEVNERWAVEGARLDTLVARLGRAGPFVSVSEDRRLTFVEERVATGAEQAVIVASLAMWPNPARDVLHVRIKDAGPVLLYDLRSREQLRVESMGREVVLDVSHLPPGVYTVVAGRERSQVVIAR